jgi:hypothetical protein
VIFFALLGRARLGGAAALNFSFAEVSLAP